MGDGHDGSVAVAPVQGKTSVIPANAGTSGREVSAVYAFSLMETARVSALRETSVVFAALLGAIFLKEGFGARRVAAALALAGGLVAMQFGG